jgi:hypothetical protein
VIRPFPVPGRRSLEVKSAESVRIRRQFLRYIRLIVGYFKPYLVVAALMENETVPSRPQTDWLPGLPMGLWRDSIIFKRTRLCNRIGFPVGREIGVATSVHDLDRLSYSPFAFWKHMASFSWRL